MHIVHIYNETILSALNTLCKTPKVLDVSKKSKVSTKYCEKYIFAIRKLLE